MNDDDRVNRIIAGLDPIYCRHCKTFRPADVAVCRCRDEMSGAVVADGPWEAPIPLGRGSATPRPFPVHVLPGWARDFVEQLAVETQTPPDLAAGMVLAALATAAGGRAVVEVRPNWREPLNLYVAVAMPPGSRKTPVFNRVARPVIDAEMAQVADTVPLIAEARVRRKAADAAADKAQTEADRASKDAQEEALHFAAAQRQLAESITVPTLPRLLADDATPEALTSLMAEQGGRLGVLSDEGVVFDIMAGRYSSSPNLGVYLKAHVGSPIRVDRKGRAAEVIPAPALTMGLTIQPGLLAMLARVQGARDRGLLARFLWINPPDGVGHRQIGPPAMTVDAEDAFADSIRTLIASLAEWTDPAVIPFTPAADAALAALERRLEPRLRAAGDLAHLRDWTAKLAGHTARIAGLLHLAGNVTAGWGKAVEVETVAGAIEVADYLIEHALNAFDLMEADADVAGARRLLRWIKGKTTFSHRDAHTQNRPFFQKSSDLEPALRLLVDHGFIRRLPRPRSSGPGRPASAQYTVSPYLESETPAQ